jgi:hypothetical protein
MTRGRPATPALLLLLWLLTGCSSPAPAHPPEISPIPRAVAPTPNGKVIPPTKPNLTITPEAVQQGEMATLAIDQPLVDVTIHIDGLQEQPRPFRYHDTVIAFIGLPAAAKEGAYPVTVSWSGGTWQGELNVVHKRFTEDRLVVTEQQEELYYDPRSDSEWAEIFALRRSSAPEPQWTGIFHHPMNGNPEITTYFGEIRFVNGKETGRHSGMDFAAEEGTPFMAPAPGRVILAKSIILTGNTIIIDHGMNLFTAYYHAQSLAVKPGDWVSTGQTIGKVGNTGFSTGAHLHWTATIGNTPVDPWPLTQVAPLSIGSLEVQQPS